MNPVARVAVDVPLAHLDRPFDYLVPERLAADAVPGCRVRVRFHGRLVDGYVLERAGACGAEAAAAVSASLAGGRGAVVVVPDARDVARVDAALGAALGPGRHVALTADLGPAKRYRRWLAVRRGAVSAVVGTRAAMFAPVPNLGLVVVWDDGDDLHAEPLAPYPHVRV